MHAKKARLILSTKLPEIVEDKSVYFLNTITSVNMTGPSTADWINSVSITLDISDTWKASACFSVKNAPKQYFTQGRTKKTVTDDRIRI